MRKITVKEIVSKNLKEKRGDNLKESLSKLKQIRDKKLLHKETSKTIMNLMNEGYNFNEISKELREFDNPLPGLGEKIGKYISGFSNKSDGNVGSNRKSEDFSWEKMGTEALKTMAIEYAIKWTTSALGIGPQWSASLAKTFSQINPIDLISIFKNTVQLLNNLI